MASVDLKAVITADDKATPVLRKFHSSVGDIAKGVALGQLAFTGLTKAAGFLGKAVGDTVRSFSDSQKEAAQLNAVLKSTKGVVGLTADELLDMASALQRQTTYSDEAVLSAENLLLTFTNIGKNVFPEATKTVLDMSTALGQDTKSSAIQLGKALQDPILGVTALRRVGVNFSEDQQKVIQRLVETGKTLDAQKLILQELATEFGGSAAAQAQTFQGRMEQLANATDDLKERIGEAIVKGITPFVNKVAEFVNSPLGEQFTQSIVAAIGGFFQAVQTAIQWVGALWDAFRGFLSYLKSDAPILVTLRQAVNDMLAAFRVLWGVIKAELLPALKLLWEQVGPILTPALKTLGSVVGVAVIGAIIGLAKALEGVARFMSVVIDGATKLIELLAKLSVKANEASSRLKGTGVNANIISVPIFGPALEASRKLTGARAFGGPVSAGKSYLVGERGPERFTPTQSGMIDPNPGSTVSVNFNGPISMNSDMDVNRVGEMLARQIRLVSQGAV